MASSTQAESILADVIEYLTEGIIFTDIPSDRLDRWEDLQLFWKQLPEKPSYGRLFARYRLAKIMTAIAHTDPYSQEEIVFEGGKKSFLSPPLPLVRWSPQHWMDLEGLLKSTRDVLLREDVDMLEGEQDDDNDDRAESDLYNQKMDRLIMYIRVNKALADFRQTLEVQLDTKDTRVKVEPSILAKFGETVQTDFADEERSRQSLESLLVRGKSGTSTRSHGVSLVSTEELAAILRKKPFCLTTLSHRLKLLLQRWARDVFANKPTLTLLGYNPDKLKVAIQESSDSEAEDVKLPARDSEPMPAIEEESEDNDENTSPPQKVARRPKRKRDTTSVESASPTPAVKNLRSARRDLQNEGTDPMQEIQRVAATATRTSPRMNLLDKKKSATRVQFGDSEEEDSDDDEGARAQLSEVPARARLPERKPKSPKKQPKGGKQKRVPFSDDEKNAIRRGVEKFGVGKWAEIKSDYALILRNRTSVNIKDCYRTMKGKGEVE